MEQSELAKPLNSYLWAPAKLTNFSHVDAATGLRVPDPQPRLSIQLDPVLSAAIVYEDILDADVLDADE